MTRVILRTRRVEPAVPPVEMAAATAEAITSTADGAGNGFATAIKVVAVEFDQVEGVH